MCTVLPFASVTTTCAACATVTPSTNASGQTLRAREGESVREARWHRRKRLGERSAVGGVRRRYAVWEVKVDYDPVAVLDLETTRLVADLKPPGMALPVTALYDHGRLSRSRDPGRCVDADGEADDHC